MSAGCGGRLGEEGLAECSDRVVNREPEKCDLKTDYENHEERGVAWCIGF